MNATTVQIAPGQPLPLQRKQQVTQLVQPVPTKQLGIYADKTNHNGLNLLVRETKKSKRYEVLGAGTRRKLLQIKTNFFTVHMRKEAIDVQDKEQPRHLFDMVYDYSNLKRGDLLTSFAIHYPKKKDVSKDALESDEEAGDQDPGSGEKIVEIKGNFKRKFFFFFFLFFPPSIGTTLSDTPSLTAYRKTSGRLQVDRHVQKPANGRTGGVSRDGRQPGRLQGRSDGRDSRQ